MLVRKMRKSQKLYLTKDIEVEVLRVEGGSVLLGITAPEEVRVYFDEKPREPLTEPTAGR